MVGYWRICTPAIRGLLFDDLLGGNEAVQILTEGTNFWIRLANSTVFRPDCDLGNDSHRRDMSKASKFRDWQC